MAITNTFLEEIAKAVAGESHAMPTYANIGTDTITSIGITATTLVGEQGTRKLLTATRSTRFPSFSTFRLSTDVANTVTGDPIKSVGIFNTSATSGGLLVGEIVTGITHTINFDLEIKFDLEIDRA